MIMKVTVYNEGTSDQVIDPGMKSTHLWSTVRKEGNVEQLITLFLDKANQVAARLRDNSASGLEETSAAQFLVGLGAVVIDVLPMETVKQENVDEGTSAAREEKEAGSAENNSQVEINDPISVTGNKTGSAENNSQVDINDPISVTGNKTDIEESSTNRTMENIGRKGGSKKKDNDSEGLITGADCLDSNVKEERSSDASVSNVAKGRELGDEGTQDDLSIGSESDDDFEPLDNYSRSEGNKITPRRSSKRLQHRIKRKGVANKKASASKEKSMKIKHAGEKKNSSGKDHTRLFPCCEPTCSSKLSSRRTLINHLKGQHNYEADKAVSTIYLWYKPYERRQSQKHKTLNVSLTPFVCMICKDKGFQSRPLLHSHLCTFHELTKEQSDVEVAKEYGVINSTKLPDSVFLSVDVKIEIAKPGSTQDADAGHIVQKSKPTCPKCAAEFEQVSDARFHFEHECTSNPLQCDQCGTQLESISGYKMHMENHSNQQNGVSYKCETCNKVFYHRYLLSQHVMTHNPTYMCDYCGKSFPSRALYEDHKNLKHTRDKKFPCSECSKIYYTKKARRVHLSSAHGDQETVSCHICGKLLKPSSMNVHLANVHCEDEAVTCMICNKEFKRQNYLDDHTKEVHGGGGGTLFPCTWPDCDKVFIRKRSLKCHLDVHKDVRPHDCSLCSKKFRSKAHLANHMNWHKGIKPYKCPHCEKSFLTNGNLTKHLVTHKRKKESTDEVRVNSKEILVVSSQATASETEQQVLSLEGQNVPAVLRTASGLHVPIGEMRVGLDSVVAEAYNLALNS